MQKHRAIWIALAAGILAVVAGGLYGLLSAQRDPPSTASGNIEADEILVGSKVGGRVLKVLVREGDRVHAGQVLIELERDELEARRAEAVGQIAQLQAALDQLRRGSRPEEIARARAQAQQALENLAMVQTGPRPEEIRQARADVEAARAEAQSAEAQASRLEALFAEGAVSVQERDNAVSRRDTDRARLEAARQKLRLLEAGSRREEVAIAEQRAREAAALQEQVERGPREEEIRQAQAALAQAQARLAVIKTQLDETVIRAPRDAVVEVLDLRPGTLVAPNKPLATLIEPDLWVRVYIPEDKLGRIHLGEPVAIQVDSFPGQRFSGTVEQINRKAEFTPRNVQTPEERVNQVFGVKVRLEDSGGLLRAGMAADVTFSPHPAPPRP
ncbi:MAG: HlyD family efflux transporter periplasmic adaptor subunit [candidate division NC10 bacterium]|nr:HlyD family efflux transporter periplasmic adaptor subunit [candidate division NC10 bacterium]